MDPLESLGLASAAARIIRYFLIRPEGRPHSRQIQRLLGLGGGSLQRELARLVAFGALERIRDGRRVRYILGPNLESWAGFALLLQTKSDPVTLLRDALRDVQSVMSAFVFGSVAAGTDAPGSDVDLFLLESGEVDDRVMLRQLAEVGLLLGREVNTIRYTEEGVAERLGDSSHAGASFMRDVLSGPKRWVWGSPTPLVLLATAAGMEIPEVQAEPE